MNTSLAKESKPLLTSKNITENISYAFWSNLVVAQLGRAIASDTRIGSSYPVIDNTCLFNNIFYRKIVFSGNRTQLLGVEGKHADHWSHGPYC